MYFDILTQKIEHIWEAYPITLKNFAICQDWVFLRKALWSSPYLANNFCENSLLLPKRLWRHFLKQPTPFAILQASTSTTSPKGMFLYSQRKS